MYEPYPSGQEDAEPVALPMTSARSGFWRRFASALVDGILLGIVYSLLRAYVDEGAASGVNLLLGVAYYTYLEGSTGQTIGKKALGIRVVDIDGGGPIGYGRAFIRYIGRIVSASRFLGYFWMIWDKEKQTWHDKFANSVVVPDS